MGPEATHRRLQFVYLAWLALGLAAVISGRIAGAPWESLAGAAVLAAVPGLAGLACARAGDTLLRGVPVIAWLVSALVAVLLTGAGQSPLIILLVAAPLAALLAGAPRMAAEAGTFAALALFGVFVATSLGAAPPEPPGLRALAPSFAFAGLVLAALMVWHLVAARTAAAASGASEAVPAPDTPAAGIKGISWVDVTVEGRVRRVFGDTFGLTAMRPGSAFTGLFQTGAAPAAPAEIAERTLANAELVNGRSVRTLAERHAKGCLFLLVDMPGALPEARPDGIDPEEKLRTRTAYFASLGHDLKTPLNAILGYAEMMQAELLGPMPKAYADYPAIIHESGTDLLLLVDDMLDLARAEAGAPRLDLEPIDLSASAESVMRQLAGQAARCGVTLKLRAGENVWAQADARAVRQIWQNLLSNAIKYSASGKSVTLETRIDSGAAILSVTDRGAGIPAEDLPRLTEPFVQAKGAKAGTGLGLSVVRRFAELHGGRLDISSKPGKGTRVEVTLPRAAEADFAPLSDAAE